MNIYTQLQQKLDTMSNGYPATESGIEIRILQRLFSEEAASLFLELSESPESPDNAAVRLNREFESLAELMKDMSYKGLLLRIKRGDKLMYSTVPFVVGIFEHQINTIDKELATDLEEYFELAFGKTIQANPTPLLRTVPINLDIATKWPVAPFDDAVKILDNQKIIAQAPCICRKSAKLAGNGCDAPDETCLIFGQYAKYYVENGMARFIDKEEAKRIIKRNEEAGLVIQPFNAQRSGGMCSCCGCCCGILRSIKMQANAAESVQSNYYAKVEDAECNGCEICLDRCQVDAISMSDDEIAIINLKQCIGCGLCVTTCSSDAISLIKKDENFVYTPPKSGMRTYMQIVEERKK